MALHLLVIVALIQGLTEFLPISSSGHLALFGLLGEEDQGLTIDVAVHVGTLGAVVLYFWRDVRDAVIGLGHMVSGRRQTWEARLAMMLIGCTIPVVIVGLILSVTGWNDALRSLEVIAWATIIFGALLWISDQTGGHEKVARDWNWRDAMLMGVAQCFALIPGTSRSGVTMTAARQLGYGRVEGARLAMLMSIPTIAAAGLLIGKDLLDSGDASLGMDALIAAVLALLAALFALYVMMRMLETWSMTVFVLYRFALGAFLLAIVYGVIPWGA